MKKKAFILVGGFVLATSVFLLSYYGFSIFHNNKTFLDIDNFEIVLGKEGSISFENQGSVSLDTESIVLPYKLSIKNKSNNSIKYELLLEDILPTNNLDVLNKEYLQYQLKENGKVIKTDKVSNISDDKLYFDTILANEVKKYELIISLIDDVDKQENLGKVYKYIVKVNPVVD